mmetsp:Transcript_126500/g.404981  ORF Transcript_126500/g.404981 Transcript_126500/m.404981 type:complete len:208 (-) Transcript_126500:2060-2683(-)
MVMLCHLRTWQICCQLFSGMTSWSQHLWKHWLLLCAIVGWLSDTTPYRKSLWSRYFPVFCPHLCDISLQSWFVRYPLLCLALLDQQQRCRCTGVARWWPRVFKLGLLSVAWMLQLKHSFAVVRFHRLLKIRVPEHCAICRTTWLRFVRAPGEVIAKFRCRRLTQRSWSMQCFDFGVTISEISKPVRGPLTWCHGWPCEVKLHAWQFT